MSDPLAQAYLEFDEWQKRFEVSLSNDRQFDMATLIDIYYASWKAWKLDDTFEQTPPLDWRDKGVPR